MPDSMAKMLDQLAIPATARSFAQIDAAHALVSGTPLPAPSGVFPRFVEAEVRKLKRMFIDSIAILG